MELQQRISGTVCVRLISADIALALEYISNTGICVSKVKQKDTLTAEFRIARGQLRDLNTIIQSRGDRLELVGREGAYWGFRRLIKRPVLVFGLIFLLFLTLFLPTRVLFIRVEGNNFVPACKILEVAESCGVTFGAKARKIRSEQIKNGMLQSIPQLQWAGVNMDGCVAVISVREKTKPTKTEDSDTVSSLVALRDGYITELIVTAGSAQCKIGQTVKAGQVLISGYTDCGSHIQATRAQGEVFASTQRKVEVIALRGTTEKAEIAQIHTSYGMIVGKKQINFSKWSGISDIGCDKIKSVQYIILPGGFRLPIAFVKQTVIRYDTETVIRSEEDCKERVSCFAKEYLIQDMLAGRVENSSEETELQDDIFVLKGMYQCHEMICKSRTEEIMHTNEQSN